MTDPVKPDDMEDLSAKIDETEAPTAEPSLLKKIGKRGAVYIGAAVVGILALMLYYSLGGSKTPSTSVPSAPQINNVLGAHPETPVYHRQVTQSDSTAAAQAAKTGGSAFPSPDYKGAARHRTAARQALQQEIAAPKLDTTPAGASSTQAQARPQAASYQGNSAANNRNNPYTKALAQLFRKHGKTRGGFSYVVASDLPAEKPATGPRISASAQQQATLAGEGISLPHAGALLPARMINGLNSDDPGPALAVITEGPLKGSRVIGSFSTARTGLVLKFTSMSIPVHGGASVQTVSIDADAISQTKDALATSVNDHLIGNLGALFVSSLASNAGSLLAESGSTVAATGTGAVLQSTPSLSGGQILGSAAGQALGQAGQEYEQLYGNRPPTIKLAPGAPFTLAFLGTQTASSKGLSNLKTILPQSEAQQRGSGITYAAPGFGAYAGFGAPTAAGLQTVTTPAAGQ